MSDLLARFVHAKPVTVAEWEEAIAKTIPTEDMFVWFAEITESHLSKNEMRSEYINLYCGAQKRFRELAYFSRKLSSEHRQLFNDQADTVLDLIRGLWGKDAALMTRLDAAVAASTDRYARFGWPNPAWTIIEFEEL